MFRLLLVACVPMMAAYALGGEPPIPEYTVKKTDEPIVIDGKLTEKTWQLAPKTIVDTYSNGKREEQFITEVQMAYNDRLLYIGARLPDNDVISSGERDQDNLLAGDTFEVFIDLNNDDQHLWEFHFSPAGVKTSTFVIKPKETDPLFERTRFGLVFIPWIVSGIQNDTTVTGTLNDSRDDDSEWTVEVAIPYKFLMMPKGEPTPKPGRVWRMLFTRHEMKRLDKEGNRDNLWIMWSATLIGWCHNPPRWGKVTFSPEVLK